VTVEKIRARHWKKPSFEKMAGELRYGEPADADESVKNLVMALSELDDLVTLSSCGGHKKPCTEKGRVPEGDFFVLFFVKPTRKGFRSLGIIVEAAGTIGTDTILVKVDNLTDNPDFISFTLEGTGGVLATDLAEEITRLHEIFKHPRNRWPLLSGGYEDLIQKREKR